MKMIKFFMFRIYYFDIKKVVGITISRCGKGRILFSFSLVPIRKAIDNIKNGRFSFQYLHRTGRKYQVTVNIRNREIWYEDITDYFGSDGSSYTIVELFRKNPAHIIPKWYADYSPTGWWFTNWHETYFKYFHRVHNCLDI